MSSSSVIEVDGLTKRYGAKQAVQGISFDVPAGQVLGFIGPNGAGKTTTMKILTCYIAPTSGSARVAGLDISTRSLEVRQQIGYLPEDTPLYQDLTVLEFLQFAAALRQVEARRSKDRILSVTRVCGLTGVMGELVGELSKGYRQRVGLAQALIHDPPILILDEPTSGLDPNQIVEIRELIKEIGREKTVILSSHILPIVEATCGRIILIDKGKLIADGSIEQVVREHGEEWLFLRLSHDAPGDEVVEKLGSIDGVARCAAGDEGFLLSLDREDGEELRAEIQTCLKDNGWILLMLDRRSTSLEDVFRKLTA
jgi:ABC-2 type transport system ATP-binding protein